jgi:YnbE-like lipoprotein
MSLRALLVMAAWLPLTGCVPRIEVAAPKEPITINMNVKIDHEIHIKADKDVDALLKNQSDKL